MKIALIDVNATRVLGGGFFSHGARLVCALLKRAGHSVRLVFLARQDPFAYNQDEIEQLHEILKDVDLAMVAVYSACVHLAIKVTDFIHKKYPGMKVIWGGPHCIAAPELSLRYADGVCFSEGDECVVEFVNKLEAGNREYLKTANMAFNINGSPVVNDTLPPFKDLDSLPFSDYSLEDKFLLDGGLFPLTKGKAENYFMPYRFGKRALFMLTSRGCPHQCSYCNNCRYVALFGYNHIRYQSVTHFMDELETQLNYFDFFSGVGFADDDFFLRPIKQLEEFAERYKRKVGLPFGVTLSANTYSKEKMEILLDAGMEVIQMGVQSASQRVLDDVYNRKISVAKTRDIVRQIEPYHKTHHLSFLLDFIIDNPYETKEDIIQTYRYLVEVPPQVTVNLFNLVFFPGTPIYDRAIKDGIIEPDNSLVFRSITDSRKGRILYQENYETFLVYLAAHSRQRIPQRILRLLGSRPLRGIASMFPKFMFKRLFLMLTKVRRTTKRKLRPISKAIVEQSINPDSLCFSRGLVYEMLGKKAEAMTEFKKCITLSNNPKLIKMANLLTEEHAVK